MSTKKSNLETKPLLEASSKGEETRRRKRWWKNVLDVEEAKNQMLFSLPMILTSVFNYSITLVYVMFAGRLGNLELAGATLAYSWASVTGFTFMVNSSFTLVLRLFIYKIFNIFWCFWFVIS